MPFEGRCKDNGGYRCEPEGDKMVSSGAGEIGNEIQVLLMAYRDMVSQQYLEDETRGRVPRKSDAYRAPSGIWGRIRLSSSLRVAVGGRAGRFERRKGAGSGKVEKKGSAWRLERCKEVVCFVC